MLVGFQHSLRSLHSLPEEWAQSAQPEQVQSCAFCAHRTPASQRMRARAGPERDRREVSCSCRFMRTAIHGHKASQNQVEALHVVGCMYDGGH